MTRLHKEFGCTAHIQARGEEAKELQQEAGCKAQRWVVGGAEYTESPPPLADAGPPA
jgi:hypothetical protein